MGEGMRGSPRWKTVKSRSSSADFSDGAILDSAFGFFSILREANSRLGAIIFAIVSYFIGIGWVAALVGGIAWLIALGSMYGIGWLKSFIIAVVIWIFAVIVNIVFPINAGPL